jgi:hypothetical protein
MPYVGGFLVDNPGIQVHPKWYNSDLDTYEQLQLQKNRMEAPTR